MDALAQSYRYCERIARRRARNFYYSFLLLPRAKREAMCAVYAFMRFCDDLSDEPGASIEPLRQWRQTLDRTLGGDPSGHPALPAFLDTVRRYRIPHHYFHEMIDGVSSDLEPRRVGTFDELYRYCYQVASVVGLTTIHIFGYRDPQALPLAEQCGIAFQLTNILRDVREDAGRGRIYLPAEDLVRFSVTESALLEGRLTSEVAALLRFEAGRARQYYDASRPLIALADPDSRGALWALIEIYRRLLGRIEASGFDVFSRRIRVPMPEKLWIVLRGVAGLGIG